MPLEHTPVTKRKETLEEEYARIQAQARAMGEEEEQENRSEHDEEEVVTLPVMEYMQDQLAERIMQQFRNELAALRLKDTGLTTQEKEDKAQNKQMVTHPGGSENSSSTASASMKNTLKLIGDSIPSFDGEGGMQKLLEFVEKYEDYIGIAELNPASELILATSKLKGLAALVWREHRAKYSLEDTARIRTWKQLKAMLFERFAPADHERLVLAQLRKLDQERLHLTTSEYIKAFSTLAMQVPSIREAESMTHFLEGLRKDLRQKVEANPSNLASLVAVQLAATRLDRIDNPAPNLTGKAARKEQYTAALKTHKAPENYSSRRQLDQGKDRRHQNRPNAPKDTHRMRYKRQNKPLTCYVCNKQGHYANKCPEVQDFIRQKKEEHARRVDNEDKQTIDASTASTRALFTREIQPDGGKAALFILDSGATHHMCPHQELFSTLETRKRAIAVANDAKIEALGEGSIDITLPDGSGASINKVLWAPDLADSLLSVPVLNSNGIKVTFNADGRVILEDDLGQIAQGTKTGGLYKLTVKIRNTPAMDERALVSKSDPERDIRLWHARLGHLSKAGMDKLPGLVSGGPNTELLKSADSMFCEGCQLGKQTRRSYAPRHTNYGLLEVVSSDLCGPIRVPSLGNSRYVLTFLDHGSGYSQCYFLESKRSETVLEKFKEYQAWSERTTGSPLKALRTDNGGEYTSKEFEDYLKSQGIQHQTTVPDTPQQNGAAERLNRTLEERTRAMLHGANLTYKLWAEIWNTANYLRNVGPISKQNKQTPLELFCGRKPYIEHLRAVGCIAYAHINDRKRWKLSPKAQKLVMIGYSATSRAYRLWNPSDDSILEATDVNFEESRLYYENKQTESTMNLLDTEDVEEYQVEEIKGERINKGKREYLVKWTGYTEDESTWEPYEHLKDCVALEHWQSRDLAEAFTSAGSEDFSEDPKTRREALCRADGTKWQQAMESEFRSLINNETWEMVPRPTERTVIQNKWVFKLKRKPDGTIAKYKARLVARGFTQIQGIDYEETYAPVISFSALRTLIALAVSNRLEIEQIDIETAYLNGVIDKTVYLEQPEGFDSPEYPRSRYVCLLRKGLYGLKQAGRIWNGTLHQYLLELGFKQLDSEPCIYIKDGNRSPIILGVYVDDIVIAAQDKQSRELIKRELQKRFTITDLGPMHHILGMRVTHIPGGIKLDQKHYIEAIIKKFGLQDANTVKTPLDTSVHLRETLENEKLVDSRHYRSAVGCLMFAAIATRPDIAAAVGIVARHMERPGESHWTAVKRILRYLKGSSSLGIVYREDKQTIEAHSDADWAGDLTDRKSTSGYVIKLAGGAITWKSAKQKCTALSTVEAEYVAASDACKEVIWIRRLIQESKLWDITDQATTLKIDNKGAKDIAENAKNSQRTKHIDVRYHFIRDMIKNQQIKLQRIPTGEMTADVLTKAIPAPRFLECCAEMGMEDACGSMSDD
jgi:transposase InsO family protein